MTIPILMTKTERGGLHGLYPMLFEAGKCYMASIELAKQFFQMGVACPSTLPPQGAYRLFNADLPTREWKRIIP